MKRPYYDSFWFFPTMLCAVIALLSAMVTMAGVIVASPGIVIGALGAWYFNKKLEHDLRTPRR